jgi:hypothetical protein
MFSTGIWQGVKNLFGFSPKVDIEESSVGDGKKINEDSPASSDANTPQQHSIRRPRVVLAPAEKLEKMRVDFT